jgi:hypothetical protein
MIFHKYELFSFFKFFKLCFKTFLTFLLGGAELARRVVVGMFAVGAGLAGGIIWLLNTSL